LNIDKTYIVLKSRSLQVGRGRQKVGVKTKRNVSFVDHSIVFLNIVISPYTICIS